MKYVILIFIVAGLFGCTPSSNLPSGYETLQTQDGWYLRFNGQTDMKNKYGSKEEAVGRAYLMEADKARAKQNHVTVDAYLEPALGTNVVSDTNGVREQVHRLIYISFNVYGNPFKGLLSDQLISDQIVPTNAFKLHGVANQ